MRCRIALGRGDPLGAAPSPCTARPGQHRSAMHAFARQAPARAPLGRIAFLLSNAIGDTLVSLVVVHNLLRHGHHVVCFGAPACALADWFPGVDIRALPADSQIAETLAPFDTVFQMHARQPLGAIQRWRPDVRILEHLEYGTWPGAMAQRLRAFCEHTLGLYPSSPHNGMTAPAWLEHRRHARRVLIHPEASTPDKRWSPRAFLRLARALHSGGHEVCFILAPHERETWRWLDDEGFSRPAFTDLSKLAAFVYESAWVIGNDSGIGHLAASLGVPTLTLFRRRAVSQRWQPMGSASRVALPWQWLPGAFLKERLWRQTLTCSRVLRHFARLQQDHPTRRTRRADEAQ